MTELEQTLKDLEQGKISADHAEAVILRLFSVVGRSEQLKADLYKFRDMWCQNVDISTIDEYVDELGF